MNTFQYNISVIIPTFNTSKYLYKCIDSLLNQTIESIEIIVVDDASDEPLDEIKKCYSQYSNLIFLESKIHSGPGGARNKGLAMAHGKYIAFCDSDDWVELNLYETVCNAMESYHSDIGMFSVQRVYNQPLVASYYFCRYNQYYVLNSDIALKILLHQYDEMGLTIPFYCTNKVFRKEFLDDIRASFEENIYFQGKLFTIYTFLYAKKIICIPNVYYKHYRRQNSVIQSFGPKHIADFKQSMIITQQYLKQAGKYDYFKFSYYRLCEKSLDVIIKQIFEFVDDDNKKKEYIKKALQAMQELVTIEDYFEYADAEEIRRHIQPYINDTTIK